MRDTFISLLQLPKAQFEEVLDGLMEEELDMCKEYAEEIQKTVGNALEKIDERKTDG